jgi:hypothetical protein
MWEWGEVIHAKTPPAAIHSMIDARIATENPNITIVTIRHAQ